MCGKVIGRLKVALAFFFCGCNQSNLSTTAQTNHSDLRCKISHFFEEEKK